MILSHALGDPSDATSRLLQLGTAVDVLALVLAVLLQGLHLATGQGPKIEAGLLDVTSLKLKGFGNILVIQKILGTSGSCQCLSEKRVTYSTGGYIDPGS